MWGLPFSKGDDLKFCFTSDTHFPFTPDLIPECDVFIHAGDLMYSGYPDEWAPVVESLKNVHCAKKYLVPGNHDFHIQNYEGVAKAELRKAGVKTIGLDTPIIDISGVKVLALPWVTGLPGWAFYRQEIWIEDYLEALGDIPIDIVVSHAPMYNSLDAIHPEKVDYRGQYHVGGMAFNKWFHKRVAAGLRPKYWVNGHIHESYGSMEIDGTMFMNVAMCDRDYKQVNKPMVIEI